MKNKITHLTLIILIASNPILFSQKTIKIQKTVNPPIIDGRVNDECWETAALINEFLQHEPDEGEPMTEKTEVFICYNADYIYFGIRCYEPQEFVNAKEKLRDASQINDDRVGIILDTYNDRGNGYFFGINALGAIEDALVVQNRWNGSWSTLWEGKSKITEIGWETEIAIPFKSIGFDKNSDKWGLFLNRYMTKKNEWGTWPVSNINSSHLQVSDAGIMEGLEGITQGIGLDIAPYLITGFNASRDNKTSFKKNIGSDIFYQLTPGLKASLSINTDFAETEADARQINLTRFNLRLSEKRAFFLDGSNYFNFGLERSGNEAPSGIVNPYFSRTIGLDANGSPVPVNYGVRLAGNINKWNLGIMNISDKRDYGNSQFAIGRVKYNLGQLSSIGFISTFGNSSDSTQNKLAGIDLKLASSKFRGNKNIALFLYGIKSKSENVQGKDAVWGVSFAYPNDLINFKLGYLEIGENFKAGMGYVPRSNIKESYGSLTIAPRLNKWGIRQLSFGGDFDYVTDFANTLQNKAFTVNPVGIRFESGEQFNYSLAYKYDFLENDFNIYSTFVIPAAEYIWWENQFTLITYGARNVYGKITFKFGEFYTGQQNATEITANWKIAVPVFLGATYKTNYIKLPEGSFAADIYQLNLNFLFTPALTLYNYFQYDSQSDIVGWQSRFQWIVKPGNEILLVWNSNFTQPSDHYVINESAMRFKLKYNIRF